jgi:hypothetical protein
MGPGTWKRRFIASFSGVEAAMDCPKEREWKVPTAGSGSGNGSHPLFIVPGFVCSHAATATAVAV